MADIKAAILAILGETTTTSKTLKGNHDKYTREIEETGSYCRVSVHALKSLEM